MAAESSLERLGVDSFDLLLLHNPDRTGYTSEAVWDGMEALREAGLSARIGVEKNVDCKCAAPSGSSKPGPRSDAGTTPTG